MVPTMMCALLCLASIVPEKDLGEKTAEGYTVKAKVLADEMVAGKAVTLSLDILKEARKVALSTPLDIVVFRMADGFRCAKGCKKGTSESAGACRECGGELAKGKIRKRTKDKFRLGNSPYVYEGVVAAAGSYELDLQFTPEGAKELTVTFTFDVADPPAGK